MAHELHVGMAANSWTVNLKANKIEAGRSIAACSTVRRALSNMAFGKRYYLKIDPALPSPAVWVSDIKDATPFRIEREAQAIKGQLQDASGITKGLDGFFYVVR